jgi:hypothetical protein
MGLPNRFVSHCQKYFERFWLAVLDFKMLPVLLSQVCRPILYIWIYTQISNNTGTVCQGTSPWNLDLGISLGKSTGNVRHMCIGTSELENNCVQHSWISFATPAGEGIAYIRNWSDPVIFGRIRRRYFWSDPAPIFLVTSWFGVVFLFWCLPLQYVTFFWLKNQNEHTETVLQSRIRSGFGTGKAKICGTGFIRKIMRFRPGSAPASQHFHGITHFMLHRPFWENYHRIVNFLVLNLP